MAAGVGAEIRVIGAVVEIFSMAGLAGRATALMPGYEILPIVVPWFPLDQSRDDVFWYLAFMDDDRDAVAECAIDPDPVSLAIPVLAAVAAETTG